MLRNNRSLSIRLVFLVLCGLFFFQESKAQTNGNFESYTCPPDDYGRLFESFYNQCVTGWNASHGTPYVMEYAANKHGTYLADNAGILTSYNFQEGNVYTLNFDYYIDLAGSGIFYWPQPVNLYLVASNNLPNSNGSKPNPADAEVIAVVSADIPSVNDYEVMRTKNVYNYIPSRNYSQLWIYWEYAVTPLPRQQMVMLDNIVVTKNCPSLYNWYFQNKTLTTQTLYDGIIIKAGAAIVTGGSGPGPVVVTSGADIKFKADNYIALENGFWTEDGALFSADINSPITNCMIYGSTGRSVDASDDMSPSKAEEQNLQVAPNPTTGQVTLALQHVDQYADLVVIDQMGQQVMTQRLSSQQTQVDLSALLSGVYTLKVISDGKLYYRKVVLQH